MPDIFTLPEFVSFLQVPEFDAATATLARDLATAEIRLYVGADTYDALADVTAFKAIALALAKRIVLNPDALRSTTVQIDDYSETKTWATESMAGGELTDAERNRIDRIMGRTAGAFTIRAAASPTCSYPLPQPW